MHKARVVILPMVRRDSNPVRQQHRGIRHRFLSLKQPALPEGQSILKTKALPEQVKRTVRPRTEASELTDVSKGRRF